MVAYYNEINPYAAQWLRNLMAAGLIPAGYVDERSIEDVAPSDLAGYAQCHFFAGIGAWALALRNAGWPDNRPVWTASCPCQPFSSAGKSAGFDDDRHLWPSLYWIIAQCRPSAVLGEQVASKAAEPWVDLVQADVEALGYAFGCVPFPSAGVGAPQIRDRAYWVANADSNGRSEAGQRNAETRGHGPERDGAIVGLADASIGGGWALNGQPGTGVRKQEPVGGRGVFGGVGDTTSPGPLPRTQSRVRRGEEGPRARDGKPERPGADGGPSPLNGFWADSDWLGCRDGKWRPVEPGTFPLANGATARVGRLRAYGNAINAEAATAWIETVMEVIG